jgi:hypothetical protein
VAVVAVAVAEEATDHGQSDEPKFLSTTEWYSHEHVAYEVRGVDDGWRVDPGRHRIDRVGAAFAGNAVHLDGARS